MVKEIKDRIIHNIDGLIAAIQLKGDLISYKQTSSGAGIKQKIFDQLLCGYSYAPFLHTAAHDSDRIESSVLENYLVSLKQEMLRLSNYSEISEWLDKCELEITHLSIKKR